jgi:hypothetical protein
LDSRFLGALEVASDITSQSANSAAFTKWYFDPTLCESGAESYRLNFSEHRFDRDAGSTLGSRGASFTAICSAIAVRRGASNAHEIAGTLLAGWLRDGLIIGIEDTCG